MKPVYIKLLGHYNENKQTKAYFEELSLNTGNQQELTQKIIFLPLFSSQLLDIVRLKCILFNISENISFYYLFSNKICQ